ncbi:MAG: hypothetical protein LLG20_19365 [Acidobacteriales bacterium]|nr:hypothetical protein [Terriglobales bacterium]
MKRALLLPLLVAGLYARSDAPVAREGRYWVQTIVGSHPAGARDRLRISTRGRIKLQGGASSGVAYTVKKRVDASSRGEAERLLREVRIDVGSQSGLHLSLAFPRRQNVWADVYVTAPRTLAESHLESEAGGVEAYDMAGAVVAESAGGRIQMDRVGGPITARTGGGDIRFGRVGASVRCLTAGGAVRADHLGGESWLETAGGEIYLGEAMAPVHVSTAGGNIRVSKAASYVDARTAGGLIEVFAAGGPVSAESSGGSITVNSARGVRCETAAGAISMRSVQGALRASTGLGSVFAQLPPGARLEDSFLNTGSGDIVVVLPSNLAVTIRARSELIGAGKIVSDFPEIRVDEAILTNARSAVAQGSLNGGGPLLRLATSGGVIYLRRQK